MDTRSGHTVRRSKNPCLVGLTGIVYLETENAFRIITREDQQKRMWLYDLRHFVSYSIHQSFADRPHEVIPKANSIFTFSVPLYAFSPPMTEDASSTEKDTMTGSADQLPSNVTLPAPDTTVLDLPHLEFELYGNQFCFRSADRATRKFKHKETIEL